VPSPALRFLDYVFLALLYLFLLRVVRAVWVELREPRLVPMTPAPVSVANAPAPVATGPAGGRSRSSPRKLVVVEPDDARGASFALDGELTIGRAPGCAVALPSDTFVSQMHARVFRRGDEYWLEDLGSTNGTLVNGRKVDRAVPVPVRRGDRVQVGRSVLELQK
jgi:pSer/pThr/pTyr-binding forkhead associated (FHA) protein